MRSIKLWLNILNLYVNKEWVRKSKYSILKSQIRLNFIFCIIILSVAKYYFYNNWNYDEKGYREASSLDKVIGVRVKCIFQMS